MRDYYYILGINRNADLKEIQTAYRKLAVKFHPKDNGKDAFYTHYFRNISEAYQVLSDDHRRYRYDKQLNEFLNKKNQKTQKSAVSPPPVITSFFASKKASHIGELLTISWEVLNADTIHIDPIGQVASNGTQTIRLQDKHLKQEFILLELRAKNGENPQTVSKSLQITNLDFYELDDFEEETPLITEPIPKRTSFTKKQPKSKPKKKKQSTPKQKVRPSINANQLNAYLVVGALMFLMFVMLYIIYTLNPIF